MQTLVGKEKSLSAKVATKEMEKQELQLRIE
jgi:hypothetical protein